MSVCETEIERCVSVCLLLTQLLMITITTVDSVEHTPALFGHAAVYIIEGVSIQHLSFHSFNIWF